MSYIAIDKEYIESIINQEKEVLKKIEGNEILMSHTFSGAKSTIRLLEDILNKGRVITNSNEIKEQEKINEEEPLLVGYLKKPQGIKGYEVAEAGHPVYDIAGKYVIFLKHEKFAELTVTYNKSTLKESIHFV